MAYEANKQRSYNQQMMDVLKYIAEKPTEAGEADYPTQANVRESVEFDSGNKIGTLDLPSVGNVKEGIKFDNNTKTGTYPTTEDSKAEQLAADQAAVTAAKANIRLGTEIIGAEAGTLDLPAEADVKEGVTFDQATKTGTYAPPAADYPAEADVRSGVEFDDGEKTGTLEWAFLDGLSRLDLSYNSLASFDVVLPDSLVALGLTNNSLASFDAVLPASLKYLDLSNNALTSFDAVLPDSLVALSLYENALDVDSVDYVLASLVANGVVVDGVTVHYAECYLSEGTNAVPSAAGLANRDILVSRGWFVEVNS
jgi:hypothetical protein